MASTLPVGQTKQPQDNAISPDGNDEPLHERAREESPSAEQIPKSLEMAQKSVPSRSSDANTLDAQRSSLTVENQRLLDKVQDQLQNQGIDGKVIVVDGTLFDLIKKEVGSRRARGQMAPREDPDLKEETQGARWWRTGMRGERYDLLDTLEDFDGVLWPTLGVEVESQTVQQGDRAVGSDEEDIPQRGWTFEDECQFTELWLKLWRNRVEMPITIM